MKNEIIGRLIDIIVVSVTLLLLVSALAVLVGIQNVVIVYGLVTSLGLAVIGLPLLKVFEEDINTGICMSVLTIAMFMMIL